jgi:hypothetical protein
VGPDVTDPLAGFPNGTAKLAYLQRAVRFPARLLPRPAIAIPEAELGDGGLTTWTAQLMHDAKERCLVSCIATERLTALASQAT